MLHVRLPVDGASAKKGDEVDGPILNQEKVLRVKEPDVRMQDATYVHVLYASSNICFTYIFVTIMEDISSCK